MEQETFDDLRQFIESAKKVGDWKEIKGADWNIEIGALIETSAELISQPPMLIFDDIKGYSTGFRVVSLLFANYKRVALGLGLPYDRTKLEVLRLATQKIRSAKPLPPVLVSRAPVMENFMNGDEMDLFKFPVLRSHETDGGRYIGTGDVVINSDPDSGYINLGTYRMQVHERDTLGLWTCPGQHGRQICEKYWDRGENCPIVATFGQDPLTFMASSTKIPWQSSELDYVGGLRGKPLEIIKGPVTGLPIPAHAEVAIEGYVLPPKQEARAEGPFGEWTGYYSGGTIGTGESQPIVKVSAIYHRNNPILQDEAPLWPGAVRFDLNLRAGLLWDQLESIGIQDVVGVYGHSNYLFVVSIKQRYAGHAKQAGLATIAASASAKHGRYVVVVDDDIDPTNLKEVLWAMMTRVDPATDLEVTDGCWSTPLDPRMPPEKRAAQDNTNSRAVFYAVKPFLWREKFAQVSRISKELRAKIINDYSDHLPFPKI